MMAGSPKHSFCTCRGKIGDRDKLVRHSKTLGLMDPNNPHGRMHLKNSNGSPGMVLDVETPPQKEGHSMETPVFFQAVHTLNSIPKNNMSQ